MKDEGGDMKFDYHEHTLAKLHTILDDLYYEYACGYIHFYNLLVNLKESKELTQSHVENMQAQIKHFTGLKDEQVCQKHKITPLFLEEWIQKQRNDM